ncbi:histidine phosphatase family protein [Streptococcus suis]|uniref:histidine phosphatase family protein n=1 Tax=Streptococcus suis TaxID=1307 RepID=UPI001C94E9CC|nr:histidine phosphatase family protein [Streptococcus suis]MBY5024827.1 histidine phosphatase family protein [Streptococcus suis]QZT18394.1 histidine phosphatase family protein [Streptococcus suis]
MKIYLMRHGETDLNKKRCFYGNLDVSINQRGREQAQILHTLMHDIPIDKVYVSSLRRSLETAQLVFPASIPIPLKNLDEKGFGLWEGLTADQIQEQFPMEWEAWLAEPFTYKPPEAEAFGDFQNRVWTEIDRIIKDYPNQSLALVAHLGVLRLIYQRLVDPSAIFWDIDFPQGTVTVVEKEETDVTAYLLGKEVVDDKKNS